VHRPSFVVEKPEVTRCKDEESYKYEQMSEQLVTCIGLELTQGENKEGVSIAGDKLY